MSVPDPTFRYEAWSPGAQANWDQSHALAIEKLRGAKAFVLTFVGDEEAGMIATSCETPAHMKLAGVLALSVASELLERLGDIEEEADDGE